MILVVIFLIWYALSWYTVKKQDKLMNSYLITTNTLTYEIMQCLNVSNKDIGTNKMKEAIANCNSENIKKSLKCDGTRCSSGGYSIKLP